MPAAGDGHRPIPTGVGFPDWAPISHSSAEDELLPEAPGDVFDRAGGGGQQEPDPDPPARYVRTPPGRAGLAGLHLLQGQSAAVTAVRGHSRIRRTPRPQTRCKSIRARFFCAANNKLW